MRKQKRERIKRGNGNDDRICRHRLAALIAKLGGFAFRDDIADTRMRAHRNSYCERVGNGLHSTIDKRPIGHFDGLRGSERPTVKSQDGTCEGLQMRQCPTLFEHALEERPRCGFFRIRSVWREIDTLRTCVHRSIPDVACSAASAKTSGPFQNRDVFAGSVEKICGGKTGQSTSNDCNHTMLRDVLRCVS
jgi:hypothetical protein